MSYILRFVIIYYPADISYYRVSSINSCTSSVLISINPDSSSESFLTRLIYIGLPVDEFSDDEQVSLGLEPRPGRTFYRGRGCPECFDAGYRGRIGVFEIFPIPVKVRRMIADRAGREAIEEMLKDPESGFVSLKENGLRLIEEGVTTSDEVLRVIYEDI